MTLLRVGTGIYVAADEVVLLQTYPSRPSRRDKQSAEQAGLYKDATTGGKKREPLRTLVHLRSGLIVGSAIGADALANRSPISAPVRASTRRNNIRDAEIVTGEESQAREIPIERTPAPPHIRASFEEDELPAEIEEEPEEKPRRALNGLKRLMRRD